MIVSWPLRSSRSARQPQERFLQADRQHGPMASFRSAPASVMPPMVMRATGRSVEPSRYVYDCQPRRTSPALRTKDPIKAIGITIDLIRTRLAPRRPAGRPRFHCSRNPRAQGSPRITTHLNGRPTGRTPAFSCPLASSSETIVERGFRSAATPGSAILSVARSRCLTEMQHRRTRPQHLRS